MQHVPPPADDYPEGIQAVIQALLSGGREAGAAALEPIAYRRQEIARRPAVPRALQAQVLRRDRFQCRYCGAKLIPAPIMELLGELYAEDFPFHPNWKGGQTHPAFLSRSPIVDHVVPGSTGGAWLDPDNMVTACWPCNARKADFTLQQLDWELRQPQDEEWDGLTGYYSALWDIAGWPKPEYHRAWMSALLDGSARPGND